MLNKHSGAQLLKTAGDPPVDIRFGNDQYIQCLGVTPEPDRTLPIFQNPDVPPAVRSYYEHSAINLFSTSRQIKKMAGSSGGGDEFWVEKSYFTTEETFPTVLRRSQVIEIEIVELNPVETALTDVETQTKELAALSVRYHALAKTNQAVSTNALAMALNAVVDAPINTGVSAYRQTFFSPEYLDHYPDRADLVERLRIAIDDQVRTIDTCLRLHGQLCPPEFHPFHDTLDKFFKKNLRDEIRRLGLTGGDIGTTYEPTVSMSISSGSTATKRTIRLPSLRRAFSGASTPTAPPIQTRTSDQFVRVMQQTPLQRHLAHLTRHGINGVSSGPRDTDSVSVESPEDLSFVNLGGASSASQEPLPSGASSHMGSMGSLHSLKGRFSRFGSLNWGRRGATSS